MSRGHHPPRYISGADEIHSSRNIKGRTQNAYTPTFAKLSIRHCSKYATAAFLSCFTIVVPR